MKITNIQTYHIRPRWMFLKIETDEGICGWGESVLEGRAKTVEMAVNEFKPVLIGADPDRALVANYVPWRVLSRRPHPDERGQRH